MNFAFKKMNFAFKMMNFVSRSGTVMYFDVQVDLKPHDDRGLVAADWGKLFYILFC